MNILLINHYAGSPRMGMEYRPYYLAREWAGMGHNVTIVAAEFSHLRARNPAAPDTLSEQTIEGVRYIIIRTPSYTENDRKRYQNVYRFVQTLSRSAEQIARDYRPDVVIASSTYPLDIYPARRIARHAGARLVYEIHDIHPDSMIELYDYNPYHPVMMLLRRAVRYAYKNADQIVSILPKADEHIKRMGFSADRFTYVPNGIQPDEQPTKLPQRHIDLITRYRQKGYFIVMYVGGFAPANALDELVEAARLTGHDILYMLVGNGLHKTHLKRYAKQHNLSNIMYLDAVEKNQVQTLLELADCLYIGALPLEVYRYGVGMNKLYDYLYAARPVVCAMDVPGNPVELAGCGIVVPAGDAARIAEAVEQVKGMPDGEREAMGRHGRDYVLQNHVYGVLAHRFLESLERSREEASRASKTESPGSA